MAKEKMDTEKLDELMEKIPGGGFFGSFLKSSFKFDDCEVEIKQADFNLDEKKLALEFVVKTENGKKTIKIGNDKDDIYYLKYNDGEQVHTLTYATTAA